MSKSISTTPPVSCTLCPRRCGADRAAGQTGFCGAGGPLQAARAARPVWGGLVYTSAAAADLTRVDLGGRRLHN